MKLGRVALAAVVGGIIVFVWGAISHMVLPLGQMGVRSLPNEEAVVPQMSAANMERGFYFFPAMPEPEIPGDKLTKEQQDAWVAKYEAGPRGAVIFDPTTNLPMMSPLMLGTEFASNTLAAAFGALIIALAGVRAGGGAAVGAALGLFAWLSIDVSYWNWYRFPTEFALVGMIDQFVGWLLAGAAMAAIVGRGNRPHAAT